MHVTLFVDDQQKVRANFCALQLQSCLSFSTRNKIDYEPGEVRPGIEEACDSGVVLCEYMDDC